MKADRILLVDDDPDSLILLERHLRQAGYQLFSYSSAVEAMKFLRASDAEHPPVDLIITDWQMPELDGLAFVTQVRQIHSGVPIILITAYGSIEGAIRAIRNGAYDYVTKPIRFRELILTIERALEFRDLASGSTAPMGEMIGSSPSMRRVFDLIGKVARTDASILIQGESGTGKEMVARAIHSGSHRANRPFVAINCSAIPETLLESELFGHAKGAFTGAMQNRKGLFAEADGGTIFLDEIGDMPMALQAKLLRVLQERQIKPLGENTYQPIDVRIVAATHRILKDEIRVGGFREDLYYRLSVIPVYIPPLRERREDIPLLAAHFLRKASTVSHRNLEGFSAGAMTKLMNATWEGNVRELQNVIERAAILSAQPLISEQDVSHPGVLTAGDLPRDSNGSPVLGPASGMDEHLSLREMEKAHIQQVLEKTGGRKQRAAEILGIDRKTLYRKVSDYDLE